MWTHDHGEGHFKPVMAAMRDSSCALGAKLVAFWTLIVGAEVTGVMVLDFFRQEVEYLLKGSVSLFMDWDQRRPHTHKLCPSLAQRFPDTRTILHQRHCTQESTTYLFPAMAWRARKIPTQFSILNDPSYYFETL